MASLKDLATSLHESLGSLRQVWTETAVRRGPPHREMTENQRQLSSLRQALQGQPRPSCPHSRRDLLPVRQVL